MSRTARRTPRPRSLGEAHALFHLHSGGAKILNLRHIPGDTSAKALLERGIVRVDRATEWGNRYPIGKRFGSRAEVIERYRRDLWRRIRSGDVALEKLASIAHMPLACHCSPLPCHGEILARAAAWAAEQLEKSCETP